MSWEFSDLPFFVMFLRSAMLGASAAQARGLDAAGKTLEAEAKALIGTEDAAWPALADATVAEKDRLGFTGRVSATDPLLRTGEMRDSLGHAVDEKGVTLGSTSPLMPFHEFGTLKMPPRPVLATTMVRHGHYAAEEAAGHVIASAVGLFEPLPPKKRQGVS